MGNPATGGILPFIFDDLGSFLNNAVRWPKLNAMGIKGCARFWYAGMVAGNYIAGSHPIGYPGASEAPVGIQPTTEAQHVAAAGTSSYLDQYEPYLTPFAGSMYRPKMYMGPPPIDSGITTPALPPPHDNPPRDQR